MDTALIMQTVQVNGKTYRIKPVYKSCTMAAANTTEQFDWDLSGEFTDLELSKGVQFSGADMWLNFKTSTAANTYSYIKAQLRKISLSTAAIYSPYHGDSLFTKILQMGTGAAAGCVNFLTSQVHNLAAEREHTIDKVTKKLYVTMASANLVEVGVVDIYGYFLVPL
jgi:hypothetical protein